MNDQEKLNLITDVIKRLIPEIKSLGCPIRFSDVARVICGQECGGAPVKIGLVTYQGKPAIAIGNGTTVDWGYWDLEYDDIRQQSPKLWNQLFIIFREV